MVEKRSQKQADAYYQKNIRIN